MDPRYPLMIVAIIQTTPLNASHLIRGGYNNGPKSKWIPYEFLQFRRLKSRRILSSSTDGCSERASA
jgi:hypothetical protein